MSERPKDDDHFTGCSICMVPLVMTLERPSMEFKCPKCGLFTQFFDGHHVQTTWGKFSKDAQDLYLQAMEDRTTAPPVQTGDGR